MKWDTMTERGERLRAAFEVLREEGWSLKGLARHSVAQFGGCYERWERAFVRWLGPEQRGVARRSEDVVQLVEALAHGGDPDWGERRRRMQTYAARVAAGRLIFDDEHVDDWDAEITPEEPLLARVVGPVSLFAPFGAGRVLEAS